MTYYGKYRARVCDINDPEQRGRIRVQCPKVLGEAKSSWCEACIPVAYDFGGDLCLPKLNETVWVEFEEGNPNYPIWTGNWIAKNKSPVSNYSLAKSIRVISFEGCKLTLKNGQLTIEAGGTLVLNSANINKLNTLIST